MKTPIYSSLMGIFDIMGVPLNTLYYILGITAISYIILRTFLVVVIFGILWAIGKTIAKKDPYILDLIVNNFTQSDVLGE